MPHAASLSPLRLRLERQVLVHKRNRAGAPHLAFEMWA